MKRGTWITIGVLALIFGVILAVVMKDAMSGPTFRAEDYATYQECLANIPAEWEQGSLPRSGAEDACYYVHQRNR